MDDPIQEPIPNPNPPESSPGSQPAGTQASSPPPVYRDWREQRRAERWARREARRQRYAGWPFGWIGGMTLIWLGVIFLLQNMGLPYLTNWWALFILIPAFWAFGAAWNIYQHNGRLTRSAVGSLSVGVLATILTLVFLLDLDVGFFWPVLLIAAGLVSVGTALFPS